MNLRYLSINQLSEITGKDRRTIKKRLEGISPHSEDKRGSYYDCHEALKLLYEPEKSEGGIQRKLLQEELRFQTARAEKLELEINETKGKLVPIEEVAKKVEKEYTYVRSQIRSLPSKLAKPLSMISDPHECHSRLTEAVDECLTELTADKKFSNEAEQIQASHTEVVITEPLVTEEQPQSEE